MPVAWSRRNGRKISRRTIFIRVPRYAIVTAYEKGVTMMRMLAVAALALAGPAAAADTAAPFVPVMPVALVTAVNPAGAVAAPVIPVATMTPADAYKAQIVCKSEVETGSLVKRRKTCLTRKQWAYVGEQHELQARKMVDDKMGRPPGN